MKKLLIIFSTKKYVIQYKKQARAELCQAQFSFACYSLAGACLAYASLIRFVKSVFHYFPGWVAEWADAWVLEESR